MPGGESNSTCRHGFKSEESCPLCGSDSFALADNNATTSKKSGSDRQHVDGNAAGSHASKSNEGCNDGATKAKEVALGGTWPALEQSLLQSESSHAASPEAREEAFVESLAGMERVLELREELGRAFASGTFNIAQARYSMGSGRVGQTQYPSRILPSASVSTAGALPDLRYSLKVTTDCSDTVEAASDSATATTAARDDHEPNDCKDAKGKSSGNGAVGDQQQGQSQQQRHDPQKAPLKWFGVAVPPSLRAAEADFRAVLELLPKLAEAQLQVQCAATKYKISNEDADGARQ